MKTITFAGLSDIGRVRSENQDAIGKFPPDSLDITSPKGQLFIIADGMGGHAGGRDASSLAVESVAKTYFESTGSVADCLKKAFVEANKTIYDKSQDNPRLRGMGTTCVTLVLIGDVAYVAHVGDSRLYRITPGSIEQVTKDHSKVAEMVRRGIISEEEAENHPERSMLYRAMGVSLKLDFDLMSNIQLGGDEYYLMCTDGLSGYMRQKELQEIVVSHTPDKACAALVDQANQRGGVDNISLQIIHIKDDGFSGEEDRKS